MLFARPSQAAHAVLDDGADAKSLGTAVWLDLLDPSEEERLQAERICGLRVPTRENLSEIESTSRLSREGDAFYMSTPLTRRRQDHCRSAPLGIVFAPNRLVTIRFVDYPSFDTYARAVETSPAVLDAGELLLGLLEAVIDRMADVLEYAGGNLDKISTAIFHPEQGRGRGRGDVVLRTRLGEIGRSGDMLSMLQDSLLGLSRMVLYLEDAARHDVKDPRILERLTNIGRDLRSLVEFEAQAANKVQFLLDATLGFINIDQNNGFRVLTAISIIGVPPTLIASIYGMNFKDMPELSWTYGYPYALTLMVLSVAVPLLWFRRGGWI